MSDWGLTYDDLESDFRSKQVRGYGACIALSLVLYDSFYMLPQEVNYVHRGPWSITRITYISFRLSAIACLIIYVYYHDTNYISSPVCGAVVFLLPLLRDVVLPATMKTLLVLRLCALWSYKFIVMIILGSVIAIELLAGILFVVLVAIIEEPNRIGGYPLNGCFFNFTTDAQHDWIHYADMTTWICRCACTGVEAVLTLIKLFQLINQTRIGEKTLWGSLLLLKKSTPIIYVFYRDGTLFFIPIFVVNLLGLLAEFPQYRSVSNATAWSDWLLVVYYLCGTRLIINLRKANCKLSQTLASKRLATLQFHHSDQEAAFSCSTNLADDFSAVVEEVH